MSFNRSFSKCIYSQLVHIKARRYKNKHTVIWGGTLRSHSTSNLNHPSSVEENHTYTVRTESAQSGIWSCPSSPCPLCLLCHPKLNHCDWIPLNCFGLNVVVSLGLDYWNNSKDQTHSFDSFVLFLLKISKCLLWEGLVSALCPWDCV